MRLLAWTLAGAACAAACAQDAAGLHATINGRAYQDDKISFAAPAGWTLAIDSSGNGGQPSGAILRNGKYILRLCTGCGQASGVQGGRFSEIAGMVQPRFRAVQPAPPCGAEAKSKVTGMLDRVDFWFTRDPHHVFNEDADDCREPKTQATVWYGSYFTESCTGAKDADDCGGYFLHFPWLTGMGAGSSVDEMVFAMTFDETDLDALPHKDDPGLTKVLREASAIVKSIQYKRH